jgi:hypothetical protein
MRRKARIMMKLKKNKGRPLPTVSIDYLSRASESTWTCFMTWSRC